MTSKELAEFGLDLDNDPDCELRLPDDYTMLGSIAAALDGDPAQFAAAIALPLDTLTVLLQARTHAGDAEIWREKKRMARMRKS